MIRQPLNPRRLSFLTQREIRLVTKIGETIFPKSAGMPSVQEARVVEYFDDLLMHLPLKERWLIRALLNLIDVQMLAFNGLSPKLFSRASIEEREKNLAGWEGSSLFQRRVVFMAIRTLMLWAYVDSRQVEASMGYDSGTQANRRRQAAQQAIAQATGDEDEVREAMYALEDELHAGRAAE